MDPNRVVVAVFENQTDDVALDAASHQVAQVITRSLEQVGTVTVVPFDRSRQFALARREVDDPLLDLARQTGAGTAVSGSLYLSAGGDLHLQAEIRDMESGTLISSVEPVVGAKERVADLAEKLSLRLSGRVAAHFDTRWNPWYKAMTPPPSFNAHNFVTQSLDMFIQGRWRESRELMFRAAAVDSDYVSPLLIAAVAYLNDSSVPDRYAKADSLAGIVQPYRESLRET